jgi:hypothetical protein
VKVEDGGRPVSGIELGLYQGSEGKAVAKSDKDGFALFHSLQPGSYFLVTPADAGDPKDLIITVKPDGPDNITIPVRWPSTAPIRVRSLKGSIRGPDYRPGGAQQRLSIDLLEGMSGRKLKSFVTNENGEFEIDGAVPGLYFLRLTPPNRVDESGNDILGTIPVAVDSGAPTDQLDVDIGTSCGLWYVDQGKCSRNELRIGEFSGQVADPSGAPVPGTRIVLYDQKGALVDRLQSDSAGNFVSPHQWAGSYWLTVNAPGFSPLSTAVNVEIPRGLERLSRLKVQLGVMGACSSAETK